MRSLLLRLFSRPGTRGFDAAGGGRRWEGARTVDGLNTAILAGATTAARRAGWYARNNPWVAAAVDSLVGNVVGAGIKPQSTHPDRAVRERLQALWLRWTDHAAPDRLADFYGLQAMAVRAMVESGESFARLRVVPDAPAVPLHIDLLDRDQVSLDLHRDIGGGARIRAGKGRISQLVAEGLPVRADGRIDVAVGLAWIEDNLDPARRNRGGAVSPTRATTTLAEAKRLHEIVKVQRAKLAFEREQGQLIETAAATRTVFARARAERDAHMAWVQRTAPLLAAEIGADPRATFAALDRMMREHLEHLADLPLGSFGDGA